MRPLLALVGALLGCSSAPDKCFPIYTGGPPINLRLVVADSDFTSGEREEIEKAACEWEQAGAFRIPVIYDPVYVTTDHIKAPDGITLLQRGYPSGPEPEKWGNGGHTFYRDNSAVSFINADVLPGAFGERYFKSVIRHELGHSLGLRHAQDWHVGLSAAEIEASVLYTPTNGTQNQVTKADIDALCRRYLCSR